MSGTVKLWSSVASVPIPSKYKANISQNAVSAYISSKQILPFDFASPRASVVENHSGYRRPSGLQIIHLSVFRGGGVSAKSPIYPLHIRYPSKDEAFTQCCFNAGTALKQRWVGASCLLGYWVGTSRAFHCDTDPYRSWSLIPARRCHFVRFARNRYCAGDEWL